MRMRVFVIAAMLALSAPAFACGTKCNQPSSGGDSNAESTAVGLGVGVGIAGAASQSNSNANAGALAGAAVVDSGNSAASVVAPVTTNVGSGVGNFSPASDSRSSVGNVSTGASTATTGPVSVGQANGFNSRSLSPESNASADSTNLNSNIADGGNAVQGQQQGQVALSGSVSETGPVTTTTEVANSATVAEGAVQIEQGDTTLSTSTSTTNINKTEIPVASAAPSFSSICSSGAAGQGSSWGMSIAVTSDVCMMLQMADAYMALGDKEKAIEYVEKAGAHAKVKGFMGYLRHIVTIGIM